jgi:hypothetical protein
VQVKPEALRRAAMAGLIAAAAKAKRMADKEEHAALTHVSSWLPYNGGPHLVDHVPDHQRLHFGATSSLTVDRVPPLSDKACMTACAE